jgi:hypothetical protein
MSIVDRAKNICLTPNTEWPVIAGESTQTGALITGYVLPLAAIGAAAGFIGGSLIGYSLPFVGYYRVPIAAGLVSAVFTLVMAVVSVLIVSFVVNALAPTFGAEKNPAQALKVTVYSFTPAWIAGVLNIIPMLGMLVILASLYCVYLLYLGLPKLMKCPEDKAVGYTVVTVIVAIVVSVVLGAITALFVGAGAMGGAMMRGGSPEAGFSADSPLGQLGEIGRQMEESAAKMEAAQKSGDTEAGVAAAMEGLGALLGGGTRVEPIGIDQLKTFVPETFAGLPRTDSSAERTGMAALMVSRAEATYSDGAGRNIELEIVDSGGVSGLVGLASWMGVRGEQEDSSGSERTYQDGGRLVHERVSKTGGNNEFGIVIAERFMVNARSSALDVNALKAAVATLDLAGLEAIKSGSL